ncbi:MAG: TRAP transporter substrate-binding protein DctP [Acidobacteriota bacterium]
MSKPSQIAREKRPAGICARIGFPIAALFLLCAPGRAQNVHIKMATIAPKGSSWHLILQEMGEQWKATSGGRVTLTLYPGGVAGDDGDVVRKMRLGTIGAGLLASSGLSNIDRSILALQVPMMYSSYEEIDYVLSKMSPQFDKAFEDKGFVILNWVNAGWVHFFTKTPVRTPDDMKSLKIFAWAGDNSTVELWKWAGFSPIPLPSTEISTALQTGLVTALPSPPQAAVLLQWYTHAKNMTDVKWAVLIGATVITKTAWEKIPADVRPAVRDAARAAGKRMQDEVRKRDQLDVDAMVKRGLNVVHLDAATTDLWRRQAEGAYPRMRDSYVPARYFEEALGFRDEHRKASIPGKNP